MKEFSYTKYIIFLGVHHHPIHPSHGTTRIISPSHGTTRESSTVAHLQPLNPVGPIAPDYPAKMLTHGARMSGLRISSVIILGPRELNDATTGDGLIPSFVPSNKMVVVGAESEMTYFYISLSAFSPTVHYRRSKRPEYPSPWR